jgi:type II secretory pathway pseudopilin PulG
MLTIPTHRPDRPATRARRGISIIEIIVAMTLLAVVIGALGVLSSRTATKSRKLDLTSARTFVLMQQSNRFSVLPYDSIPSYAPKTDTVIAGRFKYERHLSFTEGVTGSEYRIVKVLLFQLDDPAKKDSLIFLRAKTYAKSPLFI